MFDLTRTLDCGGRALALDRPRISGIVNVTPDSFSDGGKFLDPAAAIAHGLKLVEEGADMLDVGGESTRPGAQEVSAEDEIARVVPVIAALAKQVSVPIAIDTSKPEVMRAAIAAGAGFINDVYALRRDGALDAAAELKVPVCLMHMQGEPRTMQQDPHYDDVVSDVRRFLAERIFACEMSGIDKKRIVVDPGFGFGKTLEHNLDAVARTRSICSARRSAACGAVAQGNDRHVDRAHESRRSRCWVGRGGDDCGAAWSPDCSCARCRGNSRRAGRVAGRGCECAVAREVEQTVWLAALR